MKNEIIGTILLIIGLSVFTPLDEILIVVPLSAIFGIWVLPFSLMIAMICLGAGVYLIGNSKYIPVQIQKHIWLIVSVGVAVCGYIAYTLYME